MHKYILITILLFTLMSTTASAANTSGYAWSESVGWFDFSNAELSDTTLTGYAYNDNTGWLVLDGVSNTNGTLSGYAWSESVGYFDFSDVTVLNGDLLGYAYNDNTGWLSFEDGTTVTTTWAPAVVSEPQQSSSRNGSTGSKKRILTKTPTTPTIVHTPNQLPVDGLQIKERLSSNPRDIELNSTGEDVKLLQQFLNQQGFLVNTAGLVGSLGYETNFFGNLTRQALIKFQSANGITPSAGYFGPKTRAFIKTVSISN